MISSCQDSEEVNAKFNIRTVHASFESEATRVGIEQAPDSRDMITKWQAGDKIHVFVSKGNNIVDIGSVPVHDISADGKSCVFQYAIPDDFDPYGEGFDLICFTENCDPKIEDGDIYYQAALTRMPISQFKAPLMFETYVKEENSFGAFRHYGTYEIMHVSNNTDKAISFQLSGFNAPYLWYKIGGGAIRQWDNSYVVDLSYEAKQLSAPVIIPAHSSDMVVSWYMPTGQKIEGAQITANIDGKYVYSSNTISSQVTLCTGIAYHMYATWDGKELKFKNGDEEQPATGTPEGLKAIDLGLPSGTLWANMNVGASKPEDYGGYYAWGETEEKDVYNWSAYINCDGSSSTCHDLGADIAGTEYDVAHVKWGGDWGMPTDGQIQELLANTTSEWVQVNGVYGYRLTSKAAGNSNSIFIPAAGYRSDGSLRYAGSFGYYWSSTQSYRNDFAYYFDFNSLNPPMGNYDWGSRSVGNSVRPVITPQKEETTTPEGLKAIDLGLPSGTLWANMNVGATAPEDYGDYFAWGETEVKDLYDETNYAYYQNGNYVNIGDDIAGTEYDVAHVKWGGDWVMPTSDQVQELLDNTTSEGTQVNGVNGRKFTSKAAGNSNSIFVPFSGVRDDGDLYDAGYGGYYWSSQKPWYSSIAYGLYVESGNAVWGNNYPRYYGQSVRPVHRK